MRDRVVYLLNNQPGGIRIGCGRVRAGDLANTRFHHLSRNQQIEQVMAMIECGADIEDFQRELYLVCHKLTRDVWFLFGMYHIDEIPDPPTDAETETDTEPEDNLVID